VSIWPLFDLRVRTPRLEIRLPTDDDCAALARLAATGIHDPAEMPFLVPWTDAASPELERRALQWWWRQRADWTPADWTFTGAVFVAGQPAGVQDLSGKDFPTLRTVKTGSWLGRSYQGRGLGREMRVAIVHLAFAGLGAVEAHSGAWHDNVRSIRVSESLGYRYNGEQLDVRRGQPTRHLNLVLDRDTWQARRRDDITIDGLAGCLELFGAGGG
jgi:RimJ/RimL family protein N-acetyltransferase